MRTAHLWIACATLIGAQSGCASSVRSADATADERGPSDVSSPRDASDSTALDARDVAVADAIDASPDHTPNDAQPDAGVDAPVADGYPCGDLRCAPDQVCVTQLIEDGDGGWVACEYDCWTSPAPNPSGWTCADFDGYCRLECLSVMDRTVNCVCD